MTEPFRALKRGPNFNHDETFVATFACGCRVECAIGPKKTEEAVRYFREMYAREKCNHPDCPKFNSEAT